MKIHRLLLSAEMVRADLGGRKTQTRRLVTAWNSIVEVDPRIQPGDEIHFCETWAVSEKFDHLKPREISEMETLFYRVKEVLHPGICRGRWRPGRYMPAWAVQLRHRVTAVRAERLQGISEEDALLEGFDSRADFLAGWDRINGHRPGCLVADNPLVWVYDWRER